MGVSAHNRGAAMQQLFRSEHRASRVADHVVLVVDDIDDLCTRMDQPLAFRAKGSTNHNSENSSTLPTVDNSVMVPPKTKSEMR